MNVIYWPVLHSTNFYSCNEGLISKLECRDSESDVSVMWQRTVIIERVQKCSTKDARQK
jgi:hypothetical protein